MAGTITDLKYHLLNLQTNTLSIESIEKFSVEIRDAVANGTTSWRKLGTTEARFAEITRKAKVRILKFRLENLRLCESIGTDAEKTAKYVRDVVSNTKTTLEELNTTEDDLTKMERKERS